MDLTQLRFREFFMAMVEVRTRLGDRAACTELLDAARIDTPIIDELLREMELIQLSAPDEQKIAGLQALSRDMTVMLALRQLSQKKQEAATRKVFSRIASN